MITKGSWSVPEPAKADLSPTGTMRILLSGIVKVALVPSAESEISISSSLAPRSVTLIFFTPSERLTVIRLPAF